MKPKSTWFHLSTKRQRDQWGLHPGKCCTPCVHSALSLAHCAGIRPGGFCRDTDDIQWRQLHPVEWEHLHPDEVAHEGECLRPPLIMCRMPSCCQTSRHDLPRIEHMHCMLLSVLPSAQWHGTTRTFGARATCSIRNNLSAVKGCT
jgi:hypothetical protein